VVHVDPRGLADIYLFGEVDGAIGIAGEISIGIVFDTDHPWQSGIFGSMGTGWGLSAGAAGGIGYAPRDIEGVSWGADANLGIVSLAPSWDATGWNGGSVTWGPGLGAHQALASVTGTITAADVPCALRSAWNAIKGLFS